LADVKKQLQKGLHIELYASAEYYIDDNFTELLQREISYLFRNLNYLGGIPYDCSFDELRTEGF
jgi:hypothetical protein